MKTFSIRNYEIFIVDAFSGALLWLHECSDELSCEAETGHLSLVTKLGKLLFIAVPLPETFCDQGVKASLAEHMFKGGTLSLRKAAKVAGMPYVLFSEHH